MKLKWTKHNGVDIPREDIEQWIKSLDRQRGVMNLATSGNIMVVKDTIFSETKYYVCQILETVKVER